jgi:hypothetical protein
MIPALALSTQSASGGPLRGVLFVVMGIALLIVIGIVIAAFIAQRQSAESLVVSSKPGLPSMASRSATPASTRKEAHQTVAVRRHAPPHPSDEHLFVALSDGRSIEGWKRNNDSSSDALLMLDVVAVYDASGKSASISRSDSFILKNEVDSIQRIKD